MADQELSRNNQEKSSEFHIDEVVGFIGMVFVWGWIWILLFLVNPFELCITPWPVGTMQMVNFVGMTLTFLGVFLLRRISTFERQSFLKVVFYVAVSVCVVVGSLMGSFGLLPAFSFILLWLLEGFACAMSLVAMGLFLMRYDISTLLKLIGISACCSIVILLIFAGLQFSKLQFALPFVLVVALLCTTMSRNFSHAPVLITSEGANELREVEHPFHRVFVPFLIGLLFFGFAYGFRTSMSTSLFNGENDVIAQCILLLIPCGMLLIFAVLPRRPSSFIVVQIITALLCMVMVCTLLPAANIGYGYHVLQWVILALVNCYILFVIPCQLAIASTQGHSPIISYIIGQMLTSAGVAVGWAVGIFDAGTYSLSEGVVPVATIITIAAFIVSLISFNRASAHHDSRSQRSASEIFKDKCLLIAEEGGLSPREFEVLQLLARGAAIQEIMDSLSVGRNTAKSHIHHVYSKLDIHSKEELAKFVDEYVLPND